MSQPKGVLGTITPSWANVPTMEKGNSGSPYSKTFAVGSSRNAGGAITDLGDANEQAEALAKRDELLRRGGGDFVIQGLVNRTITTAGEVVGYVIGPAAVGQKLRFKSISLLGVTGGSNLIVVAEISTRPPAGSPATALDTYTSAQQVNNINFEPDYLSPAFPANTGFCGFIVKAKTASGSWVLDHVPVKILAYLE